MTLNFLNFFKSAFFQWSYTFVERPCQGKGSHVACLNFKRSRVGASSVFHVAVTVAVGNLKKGCCLSRFHFKCCRYTF